MSACLAAVYLEADVDHPAAAPDAFIVLFTHGILIIAAHIYSDSAGLSLI